MSDAYNQLTKAINDEDHTVIETSASQVLALEDNEKTNGARKAKLVSLIKKREFEKALEFLNKHEFTRKNCMIEAAYILHRQDQNKKALQQL